MNLAGAALALLAACSSSLDLPPDAKLDCSASACPEGWTCTAAKRCVPSDALDVLPPALAGTPVVTPAVARAGVDPTVSFTVSEALSEEPVVRVDVGVTRTLTRVSGGAPGLAYVYGYARAGDEPQGTDCAIRVDLTDTQGVTSTGLAGGALRFDDAAPGALAPAVAGSPARAGQVVRVTFTATEPLARDPVVLAGGTFPFTKDPASAGLDYVFVRTADGTEPEDAAGLAVTAALEDAAGNAAEVGLGLAVFDDGPPGLTAPPQVTPQAAAAGTLVRVSFTADEDLGADPVVTLGGLALEKGQQVGRTFTYSRVAAAADGDGERALAVSLVDRAGNASPSIAGPSVRFDFTPPAVLGLTVCDDDGTTAACPADQRTFSAQPGHDRVKIGFSLSEAPAGGLTVDVAGTRLGTSGPDACQPAGALAWRCTATVVDAGAGADPRVESATVAVTAVDAAGNAGALLTFLTYDFRPPGLAGTPYFERCDGYGPARAGPNDLHVKPVAAFAGAGCPLTTCGLAGPVRIQLTLDEPVTLAPGGLSLDDGTPLALAACASAPTQLVAVLQADPAPGARAVRAAVRDAAGNPVNLALGTLRVDHTPPAAPDTVTVDRVVFDRYPWGAAATGGAKGYFLRGAAGAVAAGATVVAYDGADLATAAELGRTTATGAGAFGAAPGAAGVFPIASGDVPEVFVAQEDAAGNRGPPALVWDAVWTATPGFKQAGETEVNPHVFAEAPAWRESRFSSAQREPADPTLAASPSGPGVSTYGEPDLRRVAGTPDLPPKLGGCRMAYDPDLGRAVMFGGYWSVYAVGAFWGADTWEWDGDSWSRLDTPQEPPVRTEHGFAYDEARRRFVLFGGTSGNAPALLHGDTWELEGSTWRRVCWPGCTAGQCTCTRMPSPRRGPATFHDPVTGRVIVAGGTDASGERNDTWSWDGRDWTQLTPAAVPLGHTNANVAVSPERGEVMILRPAGGVFVWNGATWTGYAAADGGGATVDAWWDPGDQRWHRYLGAGRLMFTWNGTGWDGPVVGHPAIGDISGVSGPLTNPCGAFDRERGGYVRFGGCTTSDCRNDSSAQQVTAFIDFAAIRQPRPGVHPVERTGAAMSDFPTDGVAWLYGGRNASRYPFQDNWTWDGMTWRTDGLSNDFYGTYDAAMTYGAGVLLRFGGVPDGGGIYPGVSTNNTWYHVSPGWAWTQNGATTDPIPRANQAEQDDQALAWDEANGRAVFYRGTTSGWSTWTATYAAGSGFTWSAWNVAPLPTSVRGHRMSYCPGMGVVLFGGQTAGGAYLDDTWTWGGTSWTLRTPAARPPPRAGHAMLCDRNRGKLYVVGGRDAAGTRDDVWEWDGTTWRERLPGERPSARSGAAAAWLSAEGTGVLFGGAGNGFQDDTWIWDGGRDRRPAHLLHARFGAAGTGPASVRDVQARFDAGATSYWPLGTLQGAQLHVRDRGLWRAVGAASTAPATTPGTLTWSTGTDAEWTAPGASARLHRLFAGDTLDLSLAVAPRGTNRTSSPGARLVTRYAEVAVRYRLACLAAGQPTAHAARCCSGAAGGNVCQ